MADKAWTKEQNNAINAESGTLLVEAAAGSGKTSVLVERIVRKITSADSAVFPESLLVVTFTNAAAAEMRARIYKRISEKIQEEPERRKEFTVLLSRLGEMQICTMDAFCMSLVKENFHSLGIDPDFRILDKGEAEAMKKDAATRICEERFVSHSSKFLPLARIFDSGISDSFLFESVIKLSDFSMSKATPEEWLNMAAERFLPCEAKESVWGKIISENVLTELKYASELLESALDDVSRDDELNAVLGVILRKDGAAVKRAAEIFAVANWDASIDALRKALENIKTRQFTAPRAYTDNPCKKAAAAKRTEVKEIIDKQLALMCCSEEENAGDIKTLKNVADEIVRTVKEYNALLLANKKEIAAFDFPDILHFALSLLRDDSAPDGKTLLARELTDGFSEILIDEYQDTNAAQDMLFHTISKNGENLFMVGDVKQSIYRFRLACPELFSEKSDAYPYYDGKTKKSKIILKKNFRSRRGVTDCVNFVFSSLMSKECGEIEYGCDERLNFGADYYPEKKESDVEVDIIETQGEKSFAVEARFIASLIKKKISDGAQVFGPDGYRKAEPADFCILLRSTANCAVYYVDGLRNIGLPASTDSFENFFDTAEIKTIMSYLRVIDNSGRDTDLLAVMLSPLFGFTTDDAAKLRTDFGYDCPLYTAVLKNAEAGDKKCAAFAEKLNYFKKLSAVSSADALIREIYADSFYPVIAGSMENGKIRKNNLRNFLEYAEKRSSAVSTDLNGFVRYMETLRENESQSFENAAVRDDGVRVMSIHRSKGLEFPFVIIAGTSKKFSNKDINSNLLISDEIGLGFKIREPENLKRYDTLSSSALKLLITAKQKSEELRIYYVAMTRAKEKLYIVAAINNAKKNLTDAGNLIDISKPVSPHFVKGSCTASDWFIMSFLRHPNAKALMFADKSLRAGSGEAEINFISEFTVPDKEKISEEKKSADEKTVAEIAKKAGFVYKYASVAGAVSKHAASLLHSEHFDLASFGKSVPGFMFASSLAPADVGTATHIFLQYCDFKKCKTDAGTEKNRLVSEGRLTEKQADAVNMEAIADFMNSEIMKRVEKSDICIREKKFTLSKSICDIDKNIPRQFYNEKTVIIGKIDMIFTEAGKAVIVDYKTDNISDLSVLKKRYFEQMKLYAEAVKATMDMSVKECILYSLKLKKYVPLYI